MVHFETLTFPAVDPGPLNPMPDINNIGYIHATFDLTPRVPEEERANIGRGVIPTMLPYCQQDGYNRALQPRTFTAAVVENAHIRATFLPELGGRLWSLYDKDKGMELLYKNPVFRLGNLALRNAWFSGGVEFNVGIRGHNPLTCSPMHAVIDQTPHGEVLRLYEFERIRGVAYSVSAWVDEESPVLHLRCRIENRTDNEKYMYWWSNMAVPETPGTRVLVPAKDALHSFFEDNRHVLDLVDIPHCEGIDMSYPGRIPNSLDFFYRIPQEAPKWIAAVNEEGRGLLQCSSHRLFGRKLFVWGMGRGGRHWNEWLSDGSGSYIEIQAGLAHTQMEHIPMPARAVWEWNEAYTLLEGDPAVLHGEDYTTAAAAAQEILLARVGDPNALFFPPDDSVTARRRLFAGSDWGALEEAVRGEAISYLPFPAVSDPETAPWRMLLEENRFPCPDPFMEPDSYVTDRFWLQKLEALPEQNWYSLLHTGVIRYALALHGEGGIDAARAAFEASNAARPNPWALRNLAMLQRSVYHDPAEARRLLLEAFFLLPNHVALVKEVGEQLIGDGGDELWLQLCRQLAPELQKSGRIRLLRAIALLHLDRLTEAAEIINADFEMPDLAEGEISISQLWFELYRRLYAKEEGIPYTPDDAAFCRAADERYPLPYPVDFRMH